MKKIKRILQIFLLLIITLPSCKKGHIYKPSRSPLRPTEKNIPEIQVSMSNNPEIYILKDSHLEEYPLFNTLDTKHIDQHTIPNTQIDYMTSHHFKPQQKYGEVEGKKLAELASTVLQEVKEGKKKFTHFNVLQTKNFNHRYRCGLLVLEYKKYPFVLKLFMENSKTFVDYRRKGLEPIVFFYMNHCPSTRHISGLTRIKNRTNILQKLAHDPYWSEQSIIIPRKWFWMPKDEPWLIIKGKNIGNKQDLSTTIPCVYGIIADKIDMKTNKKSISLKRKKQIAMDLSNALYLLIDPHITNFHFVQDPRTKKIGITLVDTEHFPSTVGLKEPKQCSSHTAWYLFLTQKCFNDMLTRTKKQRIAAQTETHNMKL